MIIEQDIIKNYLLFTDLLHIYSLVWREIIEISLLIVDLDHFTFRKNKEIDLMV